MKTIAKIKHTVSLLGLQRSLKFAWQKLSGRHPLPLWNMDATFNELLNQADDRLLLDKPRAFQLVQWLSVASKIPGDVAEVGVYRGGTAKLISLLAGSKTIHLFDTFQGLPEGRSDEFMRQGDFSDASLEEVRKFLGSQNIHFHPGVFPSTAQAIADRIFCFVHLDVDLFQSTLEGLKFFHPRLSPGGIVLIDDYGSVTCPGVKEAVDVFARESGTVRIYMPTGQAVFIKGPAKS